MVLTNERTFSGDRPYLCEYQRSAAESEKRTWPLRADSPPPHLGEIPVTELAARLGEDEGLTVPDAHLAVLARRIQQREVEDFSSALEVLVRRNL